MKKLVPAALALMILSCSLAWARSIHPTAEKLPPAPKEYFNDYTGLVCKLCIERDNSRLAKFDRETSNRIIVAVYLKAPADISLDSYTRSVFDSWIKDAKVKRTAVVFVFTDDQRMRVQVSAPLEKILTDDVIKDIVEKEMMPGFERGEAGEGLAAGLTRMMAVLRGTER